MVTLRNHALRSYHSRPQRLALCSFWSAPRIATSGQVQHQKIADFPSFCACSESGLADLIGSGLNLLCLQSHSKAECHWTWPEVTILGADQKECGLWGRECGHTWHDYPWPWVSLTWLLYNLQLWCHRCWFWEFTVMVPFWPIGKELESSMYNNNNIV